MPVYPASDPPSGHSKPLPAWTKDTVPVTDGSERQMGKESFLLLLLTQLQNQDPTNPMENTEMTAQLAQFSQLEQLANMNDAVNTMTGYIQAQNQFQTLNMIGKDVLAESDTVSVTGGKPDMNISVITTEQCKLKAFIVGKDGFQLREIDLGTVEPGEHEIKWDGKDNLLNSIEDGAYRLQVTATNLAGEILQDGVYPQVAGKITGVSFDSSGQPIIHMGNSVMELKQVMQILESGRIKDPSFSTEEPADDDDDVDDIDDGGEAEDPGDVDDTDETGDAGEVEEPGGADDTDGTAADDTGGEPADDSLEEA